MTGPKLSAKTPIVHSTASRLSCQAQLVFRPWLPMSAGHGTQSQLSLRCTLEDLLSTCMTQGRRVQLWAALCMTEPSWSLARACMKHEGRTLYGLRAIPVVVALRLQHQRERIPSKDEPACKRGRRRLRGPTVAVP